MRWLRPWWPTPAPGWSCCGARTPSARRRCSKPRGARRPSGANAVRRWTGAWPDGWPCGRSALPRTADPSCSVQVPDALDGEMVTLDLVPTVLQKIACKAIGILGAERFKHVATLEAPAGGHRILSLKDEAGAGLHVDLCIDAGALADAVVDLDRWLGGLAHAKANAGPVRGVPQQSGLDGDAAKTVLGVVDPVGLVVVVRHGGLQAQGQVAQAQAQAQAQVQAITRADVALFAGAVATYRFLHAQQRIATRSQAHADERAQPRGRVGGFGRLGASGGDERGQQTGCQHGFAHVLPCVCVMRALDSA